MTKPIAIEIFCGVGGMTLGFEQAGFEVRAAFDLDKKNVEYHKLNFPHGSTFQRDVAKLDGEEVLKIAGVKPGNVDVLFGGPPCQGFSEIGRKHRGDERNLLILEFARLIRELRPRYFVVENVRGLLYSYSSNILKSFLRRVRRSGYGVTAPIQLLDATEYGVPQKRKRAFLLGARKDVTPLAYPVPPVGTKSPTVADAIGDLPDIDAHDALLTEDVYLGSLGVPSSYAASLRAAPTNGYPSPIGVSGCLRTVHTKSTVKKFSATIPGTYEQSSRCYRLSLDGVAFTLRAGSDVENGSFTAARPIHPVRPRCITTREAARLHSFPDWFRFHGAKWHGFRQIGNAVPPLLARAVATSVLNALRANQLSLKGRSDGHKEASRRKPKRRRCGSITN